MVTKEFLKLIKIYELSVGRYNRNVYDLYVEARYGKFHTTSLRAPLELGRSLLASRDFCRTAAGLADDHRVMLPVGNLLQSKSDIADRIRFMLHAPSNQGVIDSLLNSLTRLQDAGDHADDRPARKKRRAAPVRGWLANLDIDDLAERIVTFGASNSIFARSLMRGDLERAAERGREIADDEERREASNLVRILALVWGLFDLQIIAARLFHCEHGGYANGTPDAPEPALTTESVVKMVRILHRAGHAAYIRAFKRSRLTVADKKELQWLDKFIEQNDLRVLAAREGERLGFTLNELAGLDQADRAQEDRLYRYLIATAYYAKQIKKAFDAVDKNYRATLAGAAAVAYPSRPTKGANGKPPLPKMVAEGHLEACVQRYGVPTISALTFAVVSTVTTVSRLPEGDALLQDGFSVAQARGDVTSRTHEETDVIRQLIWLYRNVIVRDPNHFVHGFQTDEYMRLLNDARDDDFYEPIEPAPEGQLARVDWIMGRGLLANQKIEAFEAFGSPLSKQQARTPPEGLKEALALVRCIGDDGRGIAEVHLPAMALFGRSFSSSLDLRFERSNQVQQWQKNLWANPTISAP